MEPKIELSRSEIAFGSCCWSTTIRGLTLLRSYYDSSAESLEQRFGRPQQIISAQMDEFLRVPGCSVSEHSSSLRLVYEKINVHVRDLSSMDVASDESLAVIMANLPKEIKFVNELPERGTTSNVGKSTDSSTS